MPYAYQSCLTTEVLTKFDIKYHMKLDLLLSNWYVFLAFLEHLEGWSHILHLRHDCVPSQGVLILLVY